MKAIFINLDRAVERRAAIEASLANTPSLRAAPFAAVTASEAAHRPGKLTPPEKGCFLSHLRVIEQAVEDPEPLLVLEDDAVVSPRFPDIAAQALSQPDWDILFTDVGVGATSAMLKLVKAKHELAAAGEFRLIDLAGLPFFASTAYLVRPQAKAKLLAALREQVELDLPYDLFLRRLVNTGRLKASVCLPFATSVVEVGGSQIQADQHAFADLTFNTFRRLMYVDADLDLTRRLAQPLLDRAARDPGAELTGLLFWALTSADFPSSR
jgi:GR25 family glycosyltransferase involved in LPS biosynthesis